MSDNQEKRVLPPIVKPKKNIEIPPTAQPTETDFDKPSSELLFTAVGIISGAVEFVEDARSATITLGGNKYPLFYVPNNKGSVAFDALRKQIVNSGNNNYRLIVYPKIIHFPGRDKPHQIGFQLIAFDSGNNEGMYGELKDLQFKLSGIWQFIPVCQTPCISIFRNFTEQRLEYIKKSDITKRVKYMKASHIPLFWKDALVPPFRFNPKAPKEEQGKPYFVSVIAKFLPYKNAFGFESLAQMPLQEAPKFLKASKKMKAEALSLRKGEVAPKIEATTDSGKFSMPVKRNKVDCN